MFNRAYEGLLFLELYCRIRLRSLEGLPEDGKESDEKREQHRDKHNPAIVTDALRIAFQKTPDEDHGNRNTDDASNTRQHHIGPHRSPQFAVHSTSKYFPDGDAFGIGTREPGTHGH